MDSSSVSANASKLSNKAQNIVGAIKRTTWTTDGITEIIKMNPVVLFSRGSRQVPLCGFTARTIDFLTAKGIEFLCLDVSEDKSIIPAVNALYGQRSFPLVVANDQVIDTFDQLQSAVDGLKKVANS